LLKTLIGEAREGGGARMRVEREGRGEDMNV